MEWQAKQPGTGVEDPLPQGPRIVGGCLGGRPAHGDARNGAPRDQDRVHVLELGVRHEPTVLLLGVELAGILEERRQIRFATVLGDLRQIGREIRALTEERVAVDAVLLVPDVLALGDVRRDQVGVGGGAELAVTVDGEGDEDGREEPRAHEEEEPGLTLGHASSDPDRGPVQEADHDGVDDRREHEDQRHPSRCRAAGVVECAHGGRSPSSEGVIEPVAVRGSTAAGS